MKLTILGCGTSFGVPRIGNDWGRCDPLEPKNRRSRVSILVEAEGFRILVDTSPDLRSQMLDNRVSKIDAVIWTHDHADHCHGIDDLRPVFHALGKPIPGFARSQAMEKLTSRFSYIFKNNDHYPAVCSSNMLEDETQIGPFKVSATDQPHGYITSAGLRFDADGKSICYSTDFCEVTDSMRNLYQNTDILIVDALREKPHPTHAHLDMSLALIEDTKAKQSLLTHMDNSMDYGALCKLLPDTIMPAYDGLSLEI